MFIFGRLIFKAAFTPPAVSKTKKNLFGDVETKSTKFPYILEKEQIPPCVSFRIQFNKIRVRFTHLHPLI